MCVKHKCTAKSRVLLTKAVKRVIVVTLQKFEMMFRILFGLILFSSFATAQKINKADKKLLTALQKHTFYLASDQLEGRRAGDPGEALASAYIADQFKHNGLSPKGTSGFYQPFTINDGRQIEPTTNIVINNKTLKPVEDYEILSNSCNGKTKGEVSPSINESGQPWFIDLADALEENKENPHFDINNLLSEKIKNAKYKNASAVFFFNSAGNDIIKFNGKDRSEQTPIPSVFITKAGREKYLNDLSNTYQVEANILLAPKIRNARNVVGYVDNGAALTVVIGAHLDHLGYGEDGNSMIRNGAPAIHNGADDNASGSSSLVELSGILKKSKQKKYNYLLIAFSAEELGLNGSKYFVENPTISLNSVNYMINMDMVGRLNDSSKTMTLGGYGTSPSWKEMIDAVKEKGLTLKYDSSGTGPSDHTSFYRKDIPVLFFFTGLHTDYHKPSDDAEKINYSGMVKVVRFIQHMIEQDNPTQKIAFTKTRETQTTTSARFTVSMGIMPDYSFSGNGVRVDGVSDNRPAKKAGILAGDIVKQLGEHKTPSVESYMQALSKFKKGEKTTAVVLRGDKEISFEILFQ
ncbi:MAG: M28 family peptidase [Chitinophagia bacterium]|nr:M28 family peptidase [Chitinophagia bacterium]